MTKPTLPEMSRKVYEAMADKSLSFWCVVKVVPPEWFERYDDIFYEKQTDWSSKFYIRKELHLVYQDKSSRWEPYRYEFAMGVWWYHSYKPLTIKHDIFEVMLNSKKIIILWHELDLWCVVQRAQKNKNWPDFFDVVITIVDIRPKDHLSQPIPLDPDESRRPLLEYLSSLL